MEAESHIFESPATRLRVRSAAGAACNPLLSGNLWAVEEGMFRGLSHYLRGVEGHAFTADAAGRRRRAGIEVTGGTAIIQLRGILTKAGLVEFFGAPLGSSTIDAGDNLQRAVDEEDVNSILLLVDSPGGTVAGTQDLADKVAAAAAKKPLISYLEDTGAAAAYWIASQARQMYANRTALIGGIGTFSSIEDSSKQAEQFGVKVHVIRAGAFKGMGIPGTEVTDAHLATIQTAVNGINELQLQQVAKGRRLPLSSVRQLADGRVHVGTEAAALKLVDGIESLDTTLARLQKA